MKTNLVNETVSNVTEPRVETVTKLKSVDAVIKFLVENNHCLIMLTEIKGIFGTSYFIKTTPNPTGLKTIVTYPMAASMYYFRRADVAMRSLTNAELIVCRYQ